MKIVRWVAIAVAGLIALIMVGLLAYRAHLQHQLALQWKITSPNGVDEAKYLAIDGAQEWITIRGQNRSNPVILFLHGGPAEANSPFVGFYLPFEKNYLFVQWDQPGAGMTYMKGGENQPAPTLDGTVNDGIAVAEYLRNELHQQKITLIGQDWGGLVGIRMVEKRPDLFSAFIGTGQIVGMMAGQRWQYQYALSHATASHDEKMLTALKQVGRAPYRTLDRYSDFQTCCRNPFWPADDVAGIRQMEAMLVISPSLTISEARGWYTGLRTNEVKLDTFCLAMPDLRDTDTKFSVPVFFIQGADDNVTPTSLVADYEQKIQARMKRIDVVPDAGHFVMWTHANSFLLLLQADLRLVQATSSSAN
ncbi:MAG TPA: alpha/beta hydrolase [Candidatus Dormibacteraeota bacterium]|nr:alpha/beta hydrolase [Candidatus Dormibacteraeota bacterium]